MAGRDLVYKSMIIITIRMFYLVVYLFVSRVRKKIF